MISKNYRMKILDKIHLLRSMVFSLQFSERKNKHNIKIVNQMYKSINNLVNKAEQLNTIDLETD